MQARSDPGAPTLPDARASEAMFSHHDTAARNVQSSLASSILSATRPATRADCP
jgi:hypothetical protein